jgi:hypothetical protein
VISVQTIVLSPRIFANPKESQLAEITQLLFQSASYDPFTSRQNGGFDLTGHQAI